MCSFLAVQPGAVAAASPADLRGGAWNREEWECSERGIELPTSSAINKPTASSSGGLLPSAEMPQPHPCPGWA